MLSLAEMKSTEPRCRDISEAAAVEVPTAVPWITSKMLAESMAEMRYSLMEAGICRGKWHCGWSLPQLSSSLESWKRVVPIPTPLLCLQQPKPRIPVKTSSWSSLCPELLEEVTRLQAEGTGEG